jgi:hypothetical protein
MLFGEQSLFIVRTIRNAQIHPVGRVQSFGLLKQVVRILTTRLERVKLFCYLATLSVAGLYSLYVSMINEYGAVGGMMN